MTDDDDFILDEFASAYLDDEVTADERAAIEADPRALARVAALRAVRVTLQADVGELDDDALEAALVTALAAHRVVAGGESAAAVGPQVGSTAGTRVEPPVDLAAARRRRAGRIWKPVLAVAGAAAIGVGAISGVANLAADGGGDDSASEVAVTMAASDAPDADIADTNEDLDAAAGAAPAESEAGTDPAQSDGDATRETISEIGVADVADAPFLSTQPDAESAAETAADTTETTEAASIQAAVAAPALTTEQQLTAYAAETEARTAAPAPGESSSSSPCPDLGYPAGAVVWQGTPGDLYLRVPIDDDSPTLATVATVDCVVLVIVSVSSP